MKILVFIEHDIIIRHFIHSRVFENLIACHEVKFIFPESGYKRVKTDVSAMGLNAPYLHLSVHQERLMLWKQLFFADIFRWRRGAQPAFLRQLHQELIGTKAKLKFSVLSLPGIFQLLRWWTQRKIKTHRNEPLERLLDDEKPDVIIHPSVLEGVYINDLVTVTRDRRIPFVVIMNSWDNPSTKKAVLGQPDWLLVWGEQTRRHAVEYMNMPKDRVIKFGAAQFDVYRDPPRLSREAFCKDHDIDATATILLYAGSSKDTDEFQHLVEIDKAISAGKLGNTVVVYRPHPWGGGGQGGERLLEYSWKNVRIEESMRDYLQQIRAGDATMNLADYRRTHDVLSSIDALVSPLSTIIVEAALHGKPALCYLPLEDKNAKHFQSMAPLVHFEDMYQMPEFAVAKGRCQLIPKLESLLQKTNDRHFIECMLDACHFFVEPFDKCYGERLTKFIETTVLSQK